MSELTVKVGQFAPSFCPAGEACGGDGIFVGRRNAIMMLVGMACEQPLEECPLTNGTVRLRTSPYEQAQRPITILSPRDTPDAPGFGTWQPVRRTDAAQPPDRVHMPWANEEEYGPFPPPRPDDSIIAAEIAAGKLL